MPTKRTKVVAFINDIKAQIGREKVDFPSNDPDPAMYDAIKEFAIEDVKLALDTDDKECVTKTQIIYSSTREV